MAIIRAEVGMDYNKILVRESAFFKCENESMAQSSGYSYSA